MERAAEVQAWLAPHADEMAALLEDLVAIDSENPPGRGLGRCGRLLRDAMAGLGLAPELIELAPSGALEEPCIVRGSVGAGARTVYFHGHFDVVPAQSPRQLRYRARDRWWLRPVDGAGRVGAGARARRVRRPHRRVQRP